MTVSEYQQQRPWLSRPSALPSMTSDGRRMPVHVEARRLPDVRIGIEAGAEGVVFFAPAPTLSDVVRWPAFEQTLEAERRALRRMARQLPAGAVCTVVMIDHAHEVCGASSSAGQGQRVASQLRYIEALSARIDTIVGVLGEDFSTRIALPSVESAQVVGRVRRIMPPRVPLGAVLESHLSLARVGAIAAECDFLYLRPGMITRSVLGNRLVSPAQARDVLSVIAQAAACCWDEGTPLAVSTDVPLSGKVASESALTPLFIGLGVTELTSTAHAVAAVRDGVRKVSVEEAAFLASNAARPYSSDEPDGVRRTELSRLTTETGNTQEI